MSTFNVFQHFRTTLAIGVTLLLFTGQAQGADRPSYYAVAKQFIGSYSLREDGITSFACKPDGWYVRFLDYGDMALHPEKEYSQEQRFWTGAAGRYEPLESFPGPSDDAEAREQFWTAVSGEWYNMNRNLYYGYNEWDVDVIAQLDGRTDLSDTLLESLGRACGHYAQRYLWYQSGGRDLGRDSLQALRPPLAPIPEAAADSAAAYLRKSVAAFNAAALRNPWYPTIIGPMKLKVQNERMAAWQMLLVAGYPDKARPFFDAVSFDAAQIRIAKRYLDGCSPDAILFTYGDNDTYQLLYVQEKLGYRRDVDVVNLSTLALPRTIDWLRRNKKLGIRTPEAVYSDPAFGYLRTAASDEGEGPVVRSIDAFITSLDRAPLSSDNVSRLLTIDSLYIPAGGRTEPWGTLPVAVEKRIYPEIWPVIYLSDVIQLDIVAANLAKRPIYYSAIERPLFPGYTFDYGFLHQLVPARNTEAAAIRHTVQKRIERHALDTAFIPEHRGADNQSAFALAILLHNHLAVAALYHDEGNTAMYDRTIRAAVSLVRRHPEAGRHAGYQLGLSLIRVGLYIKESQPLVISFLKWQADQSRDYTDAMVPPAADGGRSLFDEARTVYKAAGLSTAAIDALQVD